MEIFAGSAQYQSKQSPVVTIGNFDGVHRGHQLLLKRLIEESKKRNARAASSHLNLLLVLYSLPIEYLESPLGQRRFDG